jgi:hypothetical protein
MWTPLVRDFFRKTHRAWIVTPAPAQPTRSRIRTFAVAVGAGVRVRTRLELLHYESGFVRFSKLKTRCFHSQTRRASIHVSSVSAEEGKELCSLPGGHQEVPRDGLYNPAAAVEEQHAAKSRARLRKTAPRHSLTTRSPYAPFPGGNRRRGRLRRLPCSTRSHGACAITSSGR